MNKHVLLVEFDVKRIAPNIALMKYATWAENHGYTYEYLIGSNHVAKEIPFLMLFSCTFSFYSKKYLETIGHYHKLYPNAHIKIGGAFATNCTKWFEDNFPYAEIHKGTEPEIEELPMKYSIDPSNDRMVMYASRGCPNKCGYCVVPKVEGKMRSFGSIQHLIDNGFKEIKNPKVLVLYDNNLTAHTNLDVICDEIIASGLPVDIHGLHVSNFNDSIAQKFAKLNWGAQGENGSNYARFSFDFINYRDHILRALKLFVEYDIKANFFCYMLFNWKDSPADFWKRIELAQEMVDQTGKAIYLFPQKFIPLDALSKNEYIGEKWDEELVRGTVKVYTWLHGFLPVTKSRNLYNWIGNSQEEFEIHARNFIRNPKYRIEKGVKPVLLPKRNDIPQVVEDDEDNDLNDIWGNDLFE